MKYLNDTGLTKLWEKISSVFAKKTDLDTLSEDVDTLDRSIVQFGWKVEAIEGDSAYYNEAIGTLENLSTSEQSNLVGAINEVYDNISNQGIEIQNLGIDLTREDNLIRGDIGTLSNLTTTEQSNLVGAINEVNDRIKPNMISAGISTNTSYTISSTWAYTPMTLNNLISSAGDKLTLESGAIKVGAGVSKVKLSANFLLRGIKGLMVAGIMVNGTIKPQIYCTPATATTWEARTIANLVLDVNEGDVITLAYGSGATGTMEFAGLFFTFLAVEVVE